MNENTNPTTTGAATTAPVPSGASRRPRRYRLGATAVVVALVLAALAAVVSARPAGAATPITSGGSIAYVKDGNVWLSSPDGVTKRQVTTDGNVPSGDNTGSEPYNAPSRSDTGDVLVASRNEGRLGRGGVPWVPFLKVMDRQGQVVRTIEAPQWPAWNTSCWAGNLRVVPVGISDAVVSPDGTKIAYVVDADFYNPPGGCDRPIRHSRVWVINTDGTGAALIDAGTNDPFGPSWFSNSRLLLSDAPATLSFVDLPNTKATAWFAGGGFFPELKPGKLATNGWDGAGALIRLWSSSGPPAAPVGRCDYRGPAGGADGRFGNMSWAPDGRGLVWEEGDDVTDETGEGLWIMPVGDINSTCGAVDDPRVFIPGAYRPHWGPAAVNPPPLPTLAVNDVTVTEGNSGTRTATFTVTRSGDLSRTSSASWSTANGTASAPADYAAQSLTPVNFAVNDPTETVSVTVNGDTVDEADETFSVNLSAPVGATIADGSGVGTIGNDDAPTFTVSDPIVTEGNSGTTMATFVITRTGDLSRTASVNASTADGTATAPGDYAAQPTITLSFAAGQATKTVSVVVNGDTEVEGDETFLLRLSGPPGIVIADGTGVGTITNDDTPLPTLAVNNVTVTEGDTGTKTATFTITRAGDLSRASTVKWNTANSTAIAPGDYLARAATVVTFAANDPTETVSVTVNGDTADEPNERFLVRLTSPVDATIADGTGVGTITNDDAPRFAVNDVKVTEGNSGTTTATFTITRSGDAAGIAKVNWATANAAATAPTDYLAQTLKEETFQANETSKPVSVTVNGDPTVENNETFTVRLSAPTGATIADAIGVGTITNDDTGFGVDDVIVTEGNSDTRLATFTITRTGVTTGLSEVTWATVNGSAIAPGDYLAQAKKKETFQANETSKQVSVTVNGDPTVENNETFTVRLSAPIGATLVDGTGVGTITNDDTAAPPPTLAVNDVTVTEGNSGTTTATFTITRAGDTTGTSKVTWATANGTAVAPGDYLAQTPKEETFAPGDTNKTVSVTVNGDTALEDDETFTVDLSASSGATIADASAKGTITNDDTPAPQNFDYTIGATVSDGQPAPGAGNIEVPAAVDTHTFTFPSSAPGIWVFVDGKGASNCSLRWNLTSTSGETVFADRGICEPDPGSLSLRPGTAYVITVQAPPGTGHTGTYAFRITDIPPIQWFEYPLGTTVSDGQPWPGAGNLELPQAEDQYTFTAHSEQEVWVEVVSASDCGLVRWFVYGPGLWSAHEGCGGPVKVTIPRGQSGRFTIGFETPPNSDGTYTYSFRTSTPTQIFDYPLGTTVGDGQPWPGAGNLEVPAAVDKYTFTATAGERVFVDWISASNCERLSWHMEGPSGSVFPYANCADPGSFVLPSTGTYTVTFYWDSDTGPTSTYSFRIVREVEVPNVLELSEGVAGQWIRDAGLVPQFTGAVGRPGAWVSDQSPWPGTMVASGSTVSVRLSTGPIP